MLKSSISVLFIVLFMQGCFDIELKLDIQEDGKANIMGHYDFARLVSMQEKMEGHSNLNCEKLGNTSSDMTDCSEYTKGIFDATWMNKDLEGDGSLTVERSFFITTYTLNVGSFLNDFGTKRFINKDLSLRKVGAKYKIAITMPGQIIPNYELSIHDNIVTVDAVDILDDHKEIVVVSQAYNKLSILGVIGLMIVLIFGLRLIILKKKGNEEKIICKKCGVENKNSNTFCTGCNTTLIELERDEESLPSQDEAMIICKKCDTENKNGDLFCKGCGDSLLQHPLQNKSPFLFCKGCGDSLLQQNTNGALPLPQDELMAFCKKCGTKSQSGDSFCKGCGGSLLEVANAGSVSKENANKKVWLSIVGVAMGVFLIAIVLKMSNNNDDYTTEAAPAATEEAMPAEEELAPVYEEAAPAAVGDDVLVDTDTNLIWQDNVDAQMVKKDWHGAADYCVNLSLGGFDDWRLPNANELISTIADEGSIGFRANGFKNKANGFYWSSTADNNNVYVAWYLGNGRMIGDAKSVAYYVRCVRGTQNKEINSANKPAEKVDLESSSEDAQKAEAVVNTWSEAHNTKDLNSFSQVFASRVKFYGKDLRANKIIDEKIRVLEKYPNFHQEIIGDITCNMENQSSAYRCEFTKRVTFGKKEKDYPSYLVIDTSSQEPKVIVESDHITDRNLK